MMKVYSRSRGFTLVEVLVASLLVSVVMAMAMKGFTEAKRAGDLNKSKAVARDEASLALKEIVSLMRRAHIIFTSGRPLNPGNPPPAQLLVPPAFQGFAPGALASDPYYNINTPLARPSQHFGQMSRTFFRFQQPAAGGYVNTNTPTQRLRASVIPAGGAAADQFFTAPLTYFAEANFDTTLPGGQQQMYANIPVSWNLYVLYLSPMNLSVAAGQPPADDHPLCPAFGASDRAIRDMGEAQANAANVPWTRSTIPFELRLLTVRNVPAVINPGLPGPIGRRIDNRAGRPIVGVLPIPYDIENNNANYDPYPMGNSAAGPTAITVNPGTANTMYGVGDPDPRRVAGPGPHTNYNNIGNDPPTAQVLANYPGAQAASSDRILARYIDPDNTNGTFVRFVNTNLNPLDVNLPLAMRYTNTIDGGYTRNAFQPPAPTRALVSVTTRFRTGRDIRFQFATESEEVSLEVAQAYQTTTALRTRRL